MSVLPYTNRGLQKAQLGDRLQSVFKDFRGWYMRRRRDWNRMGPALPLWFKLALKRVDKKLCLQFIPPREKHNAGGSNWPYGAWYICTRIKRTNWIARRAVFVLVDDKQRFLPPGRDIIKALRAARRLRRACKLDELDRQYEESMDRLMRAESDKSRAELLARIEQTAKKRNLSAFYQKRVFFPSKTC